MNQTVITYDYDPLYRLTAADYSNGDYYHYTYDAVGNRVQQEKSIIGLVTTDTYLYDDANRLASVNGVNYTWDNNGNLLNDGVNAYTYNAANQLKTMTGPSVAASYGYNGLGDRLQEIANGQTTSFRMDYNTGLTQVLNDGTNNYIYGNERVAQVNTETEYFLGDALGSVRQLTNTSGAVTYASAYDPYGVTTQSYGASQSAYGYTGEYSSNEMVYLRARHYAPGMGRFLTRDTWEGDYTRPLSLNRWIYVKGNPINFTDPTGRNPMSRGYMEGMSFASGVGWGGIEGEEIVYDYATMTRARFRYTGQAGGWFDSVGGAVYTGNITGFSYSFQLSGQSREIISDYRGPSIGYYGGLSAAILGGGGGYFHSPNGKIKGFFSYLTVGLSLTPIEVVGYETTYALDYLPGSDRGVEYYYNSATGKVNRSKLVSDILTGDHSPLSGYGNAGLNLTSWLMGSRGGQISVALVAASRFEKFQHQYEQYRCPIRYGPPAPQNSTPPLDSPLDGNPFFDRYPPFISP